jgi:hypothetical protein
MEKGKSESGCLMQSAVRFDTGGCHPVCMSWALVFT